MHLGNMPGERSRLTCTVEGLALGRTCWAAGQIGESTHTPGQRVSANDPPKRRSGQGRSKLRNAGNRRSYAVGRSLRARVTLGVCLGSGNTALSGEAALMCQDGQLDAVAGAEFGQCVGDMCFDGCL